MLRLNIEHQDAGVERVLNFFFLLAHAGKDNPFRIGPGFERPKQLTAGNDVEPTSLLGERPQEGYVGICLYGEADDVRNLCESLIKYPEVAFQRREAVDISRRPDFLGNALYGHVLGKHFSVAVFKMIHHGPRAISTSLDGSLNEPSFN